MPEALGGSTMNEQAGEVSRPPDQFELGSITPEDDLPKGEGRVLLDIFRTSYMEWDERTEGGKVGYEHLPNVRQEQTRRNLALAVQKADDIGQLRYLVRRAPGGGKSYDVVRNAQAFGVGRLHRPDGELIRSLVLVATDAGIRAMARDSDRGFGKFAAAGMTDCINVQAFPDRRRVPLDEAGAYVMTVNNLLQMSDEERAELRSKISMVQVDEAHRAIGPLAARLVLQLTDSKLLLGYTATPKYSTRHGVSKLNIHTVVDDQTFRQAIDERQSPGVQALLVHTGQALHSKLHARGASIDMSNIRENSDRNGLAVEWVEHLTQRGIGGLVCGLKGGPQRGWHALHMAQLIRERGIVNPRTGKPIQVRTVGGFQSKAANQRVFDQLNSGEVDWVTQVDIWTQSLDPKPGRVQAIVDMRPRSSLLEKEQLAGRLNRNDPDSIVYFVEMIDTYTHARNARQAKYTASILEVLEETTIRPHRVIGRSLSAGKRVPDAQGQIQIDELPWRLRQATAMLAGKVVAEVLTAGERRQALPADWRRITELPICQRRSIPTVQKVLNELLIPSLKDVDGSSKISPADFALASLIEVDDVASGELKTASQAAELIGLSTREFNSTAELLKIRGRKLPSRGANRIPAAHFTDDEIAAVRFLSEAASDSLDPAVDVSISELAEELGWSNAAITAYVQNGIKSNGRSPLYIRKDRTIGKGAVNCVSRPWANRIRQEMGYYIPSEASTLPWLSDKLTLPEHALEKVMAASGLVHEVRMGRRERAGIPISKQERVLFVLPESADRITDWIESNPQHPVLMLQKLFTDSGANKRQTILGLQRLTDFSSPAQSVSREASTALCRPVADYISEHLDQLSGRAARHLGELFSGSEDRMVPPARLMFRWLGGAPGEVLAYAPTERLTDPLRYLEDAFVAYVAHLAAPILRGVAYAGK